MSTDYAVIVGLGNPGVQYDGTRHNVGFAVVDLLRACSGIIDSNEVFKASLSMAGAALSGELGSSGWLERAGYLEASLTIGNWAAVLIKPMTYMNRSGEPLQKYLSFRKIPVSRVMVIHDEIDLPLGAVRLKIDGGEGGHNGLRSISEHCGGRAYARVRVGVGKPPPESPLASRADGVAAWVLGRFSKAEQVFAEELLAKSAAASTELAIKGLRLAQNRFNR